MRAIMVAVVVIIMLAGRAFCDDGVPVSCTVPAVPGLNTSADGG